MYKSNLSISYVRFFFTTLRQLKPYKIINLQFFKPGEASRMAELTMKIPEKHQSFIFWWQTPETKNADSCVCVPCMCSMYAFYVCNPRMYSMYSMYVFPVGIPCLP